MVLLPHSLYHGFGVGDVGCYKSVRRHGMREGRKGEVDVVQGQLMVGWPQSVLVTSTEL